MPESVLVCSVMALDEEEPRTEVEAADEVVSESVVGDTPTRVVMVNTVVKQPGCEETDCRG